MQKWPKNLIKTVGHFIIFEETREYKKVALAIENKEMRESRQGKWNCCLTLATTAELSAKSCLYAGPQAGSLAGRNGHSIGQLKGARRW